ncbi:NHLP bacteriocin system secretion protein [Alkalinema sp. FACHB-956]|uniref:NHLP bacteriocin system secretion protein n=1 Tax=Alkalinema sp. FACHB-956 TaxID=2692768 RepID=UPI00168723FD|nr:NHLP bacteriocin system secretion protein [Alkalinema sp. FACHB-956]MBD2329097.1 NHLP bacteriocin system secretion protein [Alkalinema sp. FACHB-956]
MVSLKQKRKIFREEALEQANSPEQLDRLIQVTSPRRWLSLAAFAILVSSGTLWSIVAKIPTTVTGKGILIYPSTVLAAQSTTSGQILEVKVKPGETVKKGQILATIDQSDLKQELQLAQLQLEDLKRQDRDAAFIQLQRERFDQIAADQERQSLQKNLETTRSMNPVLRDRGLDSIQRERVALQQQVQTLRATLAPAKQRWQRRQELFDQYRLITEDVVVQAQQEYEKTQSQIDQLEVQLKQLDSKEAEAQQQELDRLNQINETQAKIDALDAQKVSKVEGDFSAATGRKKEIQETERKIAQLTTQLQKSREILSPSDGTLMEVVVKAGQHVEPGASIGSISVRENGETLQSLIFLDPADGKKVEAAAQRAQAQNRDKLEVKVTPTTVKAEEYGGIIGRVEKVSPLAVTQAGAASLVGHPDMLKGVMAEEAQMAIFASLECQSAPPQGTDCPQYRWSGSQGPGQSLTPGTTTIVRITIEERPPISYVLPFLKNLIGIQS